MLCRSVWRSLDKSGHEQPPPRFSVARSGPMRSQDLVIRRRVERLLLQESRVVAHALRLSDDVRREHDGQSSLGDGLHEALQELASRERIQRGDRLVEQEQLGPLRERERQRDLRLLSSGELPHLLSEWDTELRELARRQVVIPARVELRPSLSISASLNAR